jgi:hypothetical protein
MTSFFVVGGGEKTIPGTGDANKAMIIYKWNVNKPNGLKRLDAAAHYLWNKGAATKDGRVRGHGDAYIDFDTLSRSDKLGLIELHLKQIEKDLATSFYVSQQTEQAKRDAAVYSAEIFGDTE